MDSQITFYKFRDYFIVRVDLLSGKCMYFATHEISDLGENINDIGEIIDLEDHEQAKEGVITVLLPKNKKLTLNMLHVLEPVDFFQALIYISDIYRKI